MATDSITNGRLAFIEGYESYKRGKRVPSAATTYERYGYDVREMEAYYNGWQDAAKRDPWRYNLNRQALAS